MIAATGIQDQELAVAAKRTSVNDPSIAGRRNLSTHASDDRLPFLGSTNTVRPAEFMDFHAVNRQPQVAAHSRERNRGRKPARILERRERGAGGVLFDRTRLLMGAAHRRGER